jgi:hypothetical protein
VKWIFGEVWWEDWTEFIGLFQWRSVVGAVMKSSKIYWWWRIFLDHLNGYPLVKKKSTPWN